LNFSKSMVAVFSKRYHNYENMVEEGNKAVEIARLCRGGMQAVNCLKPWSIIP
ncbi:hypothetical protein T02_9391, partial [Trichinella nativa]